MKCLSFLFLLLFSASVFGQETARDIDSDVAPIIMSTAREVKYPVDSDELDITEMMKVFSFNFREKNATNAIQMEANWGAKTLNDKYNKAVLEIGLKAKDFHSLVNTPPVNVSLVIDKSGSMKDENRMDQLKRAIHIFVDKLRSDDIISVVVYDTEPYVLLSARKVGNKAQIHQAVNGIVPEGNTNLNGGLLYGYEEVMKNLRENRTNKVILFTDGIANIGVTKPDRIISIAKQFNKLGIDLSTIGFGKELQFSLLKRLAKNGNGKVYYLKNTNDLETVFKEEAESLISPVAGGVTLEIETENPLFVREIYGYETERKGNKTIIQLPSFYALQSVMLLAEVEKGQGGYKGKAFPITLNLSYFDIQQQKIVRNTLSLLLPYSNHAKEDFLDEAEVKKHYLYASTVQELYNAAVAYESGDADKAMEILVSIDKILKGSNSGKMDSELAKVNQTLQDCLGYLKMFSRKG